MMILTLVVVGAEYKRFFADLSLVHLSHPFVLKLVNDEVVVGVGHPLKLPEEASPE
jgi:hypothetical protein